MSDIIKDPTMIAALQDLARGVKSERDLAALTQDLLKITVEASLNAEMDAHLGYAKHSPEGYGSGNSRNGYGTKKLKSGHGIIEIDTPRDRNGSFEPQLVTKNQTRLSHFDDKILTLYAKGMSTRDIVDTFRELYGAEISPTLVSNVTEAVLGKVIEYPQGINGNPALWMHSILSSIWTALSSKFGKISGSSTKPFTWRWASAWKAKRNC